MADEFHLLTGEYLESSSAAVDASSSATAATMPWSNLFTQYPFQKARTSSLTGMVLIVDLGASKEINTVLLLYSNAGTNTQWRIRFADTEAGLATATGDDDSGTVDFWPSGVASTYSDDWQLGTLGYFKTASTRTRRWMQIDFTDATHPDGYLEFGCLLVGKTWNPAKNPMRSGSTSPTEIEPTSHVRSESGMLYPTERGRPTLASYRFAFLTFAEYQALRRIFRLRGTSKHVAAIFDPTTTANLPENVVHGCLVGVDRFARPKYVAGGSDYVVELEIESMGG